MFGGVVVNPLLQGKAELLFLISDLLLHLRKLAESGWGRSEPQSTPAPSPSLCLVLLLPHRHPPGRGSPPPPPSLRPTGNQQFVLYWHHHYPVVVVQPVSLMADGLIVPACPCCVSPPCDFPFVMPGAKIA